MYTVVDFVKLALLTLASFLAALSIPVIVGVFVTVLPIAAILTLFALLLIVGVVVLFSPEQYRYFYTTVLSALFCLNTLSVALKTTEGSVVWPVCFCLIFLFITFFINIIVLKGED